MKENEKHVGASFFDAKICKANELHVQFGILNIPLSDISMKLIRLSFNLYNDTIW